MNLVDIHKNIINSIINAIDIIIPLLMFNFSLGGALNVIILS